MLFSLSRITQHLAGNVCCAFFILDLMPHNHDHKRTGDLLRDSQQEQQLSSKYKSSPSTYFTGLNKLWVILMNKIYLLEWASSSGHSFCSSTWATEKGSHQGAQVMAAIMISQEPNRNACVFVLTMVFTATYLNRKELEAEREARGGWTVSSWQLVSWKQHLRGLCTPGPSRWWVCILNALFIYSSLSGLPGKHPWVIIFLSWAVQCLRSDVKWNRGGEGVLCTPEGSFLAQMWKHLAREAHV